MRDFILRSWSWGRSLDREAAWDSARNVAAYIGCAAVVAYFTTMSVWWMPFSTALLVGAWWADYLRHF